MQRTRLLIGLAALALLASGAAAGLLITGDDASDAALTPAANDISDEATDPASDVAPSQQAPPVPQPVYVDVVHDYSQGQPAQETFEIPPGDGAQAFEVRYAFTTTVSPVPCNAISITLRVLDPTGAKVIEHTSTLRGGSGDMCGPYVEERASLPEGTYTVEFEGVSPVVGNVVVESLLPLDA